MTATTGSRGLPGYFLLCLRLNFRSTQALVYGYLVPLIFLLAFGSVFRADTPPLLPEMGQLLTITILGGACFGFPTAMVAERERGIWRRYRLLPVPMSRLVACVLCVRLVLVASAVLLQVIMAHLAYHTPFPLHPLQGAIAVLFVTASFLGLGLVIAALANDVPAVQAMGQCLFLPMIMIGGVGIPLEVLPGWAQRASGFMPGRYAVDVLQRCYENAPGLNGAGFAVAALLVIGACAGVVGAKLFRWDAGRRYGGRTGIWVAAALLGWVAVGLAAEVTGRLEPGLSAGTYASVTDAQVDAITYENMPGDNEFVTRLAPPLGDRAAGMEEFRSKLEAWPPGDLDDPAQSARNLLSVAAIADVSANLREGEIARLVFDRLRARYGSERLTHILAWIILYPQAGTVIATAPELGLRRRYSEQIIRERNTLYSRKFLGRLLGKIRD